MGGLDCKCGSKGRDRQLQASDPEKRVSRTRFQGEQCAREAFRLGGRRGASKIGWLLTFREIAFFLNIRGSTNITCKIKATGALVRSWRTARPQDSIAALVLYVEASQECERLSLKNEGTSRCQNAFDLPAEPNAAHNT